MNTLFKNQGSTKIWAAIAVVVILALVGFYLLLSRINQLQEKLSSTPSVATTTEEAAPIVTAQPPAAVAPKPKPAAPVAPIQPVAINWIGTWNGPMKITAPLDCASKTGKDADITVYFTGINDNQISGRMTAFGLDSDGTQSIIENGTVDGDKFSFTANGIAPAFIMSGNISGDTLSVKFISAKDCGTIITEKPVQLFRVR